MATAKLYTDIQREVIFLDVRRIRCNKKKRRALNVSLISMVGMRALLWTIEACSSLLCHWMLAQRGVIRLQLKLKLLV